MVDLRWLRIAAAVEAISLKLLIVNLLTAHLPAVTSVIGPIHASNNWVVDGAHSGSGKPLLANDPHLGFAAPGTWYLARLKTPEREIAGATAPGVPQVVIGHNDRIAWGFTTTGGDAGVSSSAVKTRPPKAPMPKVVK